MEIYWVPQVLNAGHWPQKDDKIEPVLIKVSNIVIITYLS